MDGKGERKTRPNAQWNMHSNIRHLPELYYSSGKRRFPPQLRSGMLKLVMVSALPKYFTAAFFTCGVGAAILKIWLLFIIIHFNNKLYSVYCFLPGTKICLCLAFVLCFSKSVHLSALLCPSSMHFKCMWSLTTMFRAHFSPVHLFGVAFWNVCITINLFLKVSQSANFSYALSTCFL